MNITSGQCFWMGGMPMLMLWSALDGPDDPPVLIGNPFYAYYTAALQRREQERHG